MTKYLSVALVLCALLIYVLVVRLETVSTDSAIANHNCLALKDTITHNAKLNEYSRFMLINAWTDSLTSERKKEKGNVTSIGIVQATTHDSIPFYSDPDTITRFLPAGAKDSVWELNWKAEDSGAGWKRTVAGTTRGNGRTGVTTIKDFGLQLTIVTGIENDRIFVRSTMPGFIVTGLQGAEVKKKPRTWISVGPGVGLELYPKPHPDIGFFVVFPIFSL